MPSKACEVFRNESAVQIREVEKLKEQILRS